MITLITGAPGSGKTLYTVANELPPILGAELVDEEGVKHPRTIYTNINGLIVEHETINADNLRNWHEWVKPGYFIVFDEVQKVWPRAAMGSKIPPDIEALEIHRHKGGDIVLITQHPQLLHSNVRNLVGRHLHVRRIAGMGLAVVYEWDHCSSSLLYKNSIHKRPWRYSKKAMGMYKSAELHTKQTRKLPGLVWFIAAGLAGAAYLVPTVYGRINERIAGGAQSAQVELLPDAAHETPPQEPPPVVGDVLPSEPVTSAPAHNEPAPELPAFAGCAVVRGECTCYDTQGRAHQTDDDLCAAIVKPRPLADVLPAAQELRQPVDDPRDLELALFARGNPQRVYIHP